MNEADDIDFDEEALTKSVLERYQHSNQNHVIEYLPSIPPSEKISFLQELNNVPDSILSYNISNIESCTSQQHKEVKPFTGSIGSTKDSKEDCKRWKNIGLDIIKQKKVGAVLMAGGQGTRLGYSGPKGMVDIGLPTKQTLFQLVISRLRNLSEDIPLYIMTSPFNDKETKEYFKQHNNFDYPSIHFFTQDVIPCLDLEGKIFLETSSKLSTAPNGNGGIYTSIASSGLLNHFNELSLEYIHIFSIDNALNKPADPLFLGFLKEKGVQVGNKVVWKKYAHEKVGVMGDTMDGKPCIVEYSDLDDTQKELVDSKSGKLVFGAGNICNHLFTLPFLTQICQNCTLPFHIAKKKIPYYDSKLNQTVTPKDINGIKLEMFIFDVFPLCNSLCILDVERENEFAPVKNATGADSIETAREMVLKAEV